MPRFCPRNPLEFWEILGENRENDSDGSGIPGCAYFSMNLIFI
jgi:hypothetical protein